MFDEKKYLDCSKCKTFIEDHNINLSTTIINAELHTEVYIERLKKYVDFTENNFFNKGNRENRTSFKSNHIILCIKSVDMKKNNICIKLFNTGLVSISGCKKITDFKNVMISLIEMLAFGYFKDNENINKKHIKFVENSDKIGIYNVEVKNISCNFNFNHDIDKNTLISMLLENNKCDLTSTDIGHVNFSYDTNQLSVSIKYACDIKRNITISVFQSGAILMFGATKLHHIMSAYTYINKILQKYCCGINPNTPDQDKIISAVLEDNEVCVC